MVGVMSMTPGAHRRVHDHGDMLRIVGIVLSLHIAGMYAFSPVTGWLTDRVGPAPGHPRRRRRCCWPRAPSPAPPGTTRPRLSVGLVLLGMGWSGTMVAGSTLLSESVGGGQPAGRAGPVRPGHGARRRASAGALSGLVVAWSSVRDADRCWRRVATVPLVALALRPVPARCSGLRRAGRVRLTDFWTRLEETFGPAYAASVADDQVLTAAGRPDHRRRRSPRARRRVAVWRAVVAAYPDRVPARLR